jgi:hypothetical protein
LPRMVCATPCHGTRSFSIAMAALRLHSDMHLLSTRYRVRSDCACRVKRQQWMVEVLRETSSDIGRIGLTGHERELLMDSPSLGDTPPIASLLPWQMAPQTLDSC